MKHRRHRAKSIVGTSDVRARVPRYARLFSPSSDDEIRFTELQPLVPGSAWSAVALIRPGTSNHSGAIAAQRRHLGPGANAFTLCLKDSAISAEAGADSRVSQLRPPVNEWSRVAVAFAADGGRFYLGHGGAIRTEDVPALPAGSCAAGTPITIGREFDGAMGVVCLFADRLPDATMQAICSGRIDPCFAPHLCFAWLAWGAGDIDIVSRRPAVIVGTRVIPCDGVPAIVGTTSAPVAVPRVVVDAPKRPVPEPAAAPQPSAAPAIEPPMPLPTATGSRLFRELGLEPAAKDED